VSPVIVRRGQHLDQLGPLPVSLGARSGPA
jgi:hypothetical protein